MRKAYFILGFFVILGFIWSFSAYRNFSNNLIPNQAGPAKRDNSLASPTPRTPPPLPSMIPTPSLVPEVQSFVDSLNADTNSLTCSQDSDCQWYGREIYSNTDKKTHSIYQCRNSSVTTSCPDCVPGNFPSSSSFYDKCYCFKNRCD